MINRITLMVSLLLGVGLKVILVLSNVIPFNSDEAVIGLMAKHISHGARPIFYYGQAYMGSLDAFLVVGMFQLLGEQVHSIRLVQIGIYALYIITIWLLTKRLFIDSLVSVFVMLIAAIPPVLVTTYTIVTLGGYGEILVLGNIILLLGYEITYGKIGRLWYAWMALGFISGIAFWVLGLAIVYILPVTIIILWHFNKSWLRYYGLSIIAFMIGSSPWWYYNLTNDWGAIQVLFEPSIVSIGMVEKILGLIALGIPAVIGIRFPWSLSYAPVLVLIIVVLLFVSALFLFIREERANRQQMKKGAKNLLVVFTVVYGSVFLVSRYGVDPTGRLLLPLFLPASLLLAWFITYAWRLKWYFGVAILCIVLGINGAETYRAATSSEGITIQFNPITLFNNEYDDELMQFLRENGEMRGYANYWVSFRLAFLSGEEIIYAAKLPYLEDLRYSLQEDRYPKYSNLVDNSTKVAYITTKHPKLDGLLREAFHEHDVSYLEKQIGEYHIFYNLSKSIRPSDIGF